MPKRTAENQLTSLNADAYEKNIGNEQQSAGGPAEADAATIAKRKIFKAKRRLRKGGLI
jgi:hypothetical protein